MNNNEAPIIRGVACYEDVADPFGIFSKWRCPHCHGRLSRTNETICLNACHLSDDMRNRFNDRMATLKRLSEEGENE